MPRDKTTKQQHEKKKVDVSLVVFRVTVVAAVFLIGGLLGKSNSFPFDVLDRGLRATLTLVDETTRTYPEMLQLRIYRGEGVTRHDPARAQQGLTLLQGWFSDGLQLRLIDMDGNIVHQWLIDVFAIWPDPQHIYPPESVPKTRFNVHSQGFHVDPDGSVVAVVGNSGTVKLGRCGEVLWTVDRMTHHALTPAGDGGLWMPSNRDIREIPEALLFMGITRPYLVDKMGEYGVAVGYENTLLRVDAQGRPVEELSALQAVVDAGLEHELHDALLIRKADPTHLNDIEIVTPALAAKIPGVAAGDLLISLRQLHMLAILDRHTGAMKWHHAGPWVRQHDPDITPEGNILVFNNRPGQVAVRGPRGSQIMEYDPATDETRVVYPRPGGESFDSDILGAQQRLDNGDLLIIESRHGRVFEVDPAGAIVWEYVAAYDDVRAALIESAVRLDPDYFTVESWRCE